MRLVPPQLPAASPLILAAAHHHTGPLGLILAALATLAVYVLVAFARPVRTCRKCKGERVVRPKPRRCPRCKGARVLKGKPCPRCHGAGQLIPAAGPQVCPRCNGFGKHYRPGASLIHRLYQDALRERGRRLPTPQPPHHPEED